MPARCSPALAGEGGVTDARGSARGSGVGGRAAGAALGVGVRGRAMGRKNAVTERSAGGGASVPAPRPRLAREVPARMRLRGRGRGGAVNGNTGAGACHRSGSTCAAGRGAPPTHWGHRGRPSVCGGSCRARRVGAHHELQGVGFPGKAGGIVEVPSGGGRAAVAAAHHWLAISTQRAIFSEGSSAGVSSGRDCATQARASGSWRSARASHTVWTGISPAQGRQPREPSAVSVSVRELPQPPPQTPSGGGQTEVRSTHCAQTTSHRPTEYHSVGASFPAQPHSSQ